MRLYLTVFTLVTLLTATASIPLHSLPSENILLLRDYPASQGKTLLFGNSVNGTVSKCDSDLRTLPVIASTDAGMPIVNLSRGGMTLGQMLQLAEAGARTGIRPSTIIFPISPEAGFFRSVSTPYGIRAFLINNLGELPWLARSSDEEASQHVPMDYRGLHYGDYGDFSQHYFPAEKTGAVCPDAAGVNRSFVEFMYWRNFLQDGDALLGFAQLLPRIQRLRDQHVEVQFWMMPVNFDDLRTLHGAVGVATVQQNIRQVKLALKEHGFAVLDSSTLVASSGFTDRWCACGHMSEAGRKVAGQSLATWLNQGAIANNRVPGTPQG